MSVSARVRSLSESVRVSSSLSEKRSKYSGTVPPAPPHVPQPPILVRVGNARGFGLRQAMSAFEARPRQSQLSSITPRRLPRPSAAFDAGGAADAHTSAAYAWPRPSVAVEQPKPTRCACVSLCVCVCSRAATVNVVTVTGVKPAVLVYLCSRAATVNVVTATGVKPAVLVCMCSRASQQPAPTRLPRVGGRGYVAADAWRRREAAAQAGCARVGEGRVRTCR